MTSRKKAYRKLAAAVTIYVLLIPSSLLPVAALAVSPESPDAGTVPSSWSLDPAATPKTFSDQSNFVNVSCLSPADCFSAGYALTSSGAYGDPMVEHWNGKIWSPSLFSSTVTTSDTLEGVDCYAPSRCWMVGGNKFNGAGQIPILLQWNGATWAASRFGSVSRYVSDVSCPTTTDCIAVGWQSTAASAARAIAEQWNGKTWTAMKLPSTANLYYASLYAVSCGSSSNCLALGQTEGEPQGKGGSATDLFGERWNGKSWTAVNVPNPTLSGYQLYEEVSDISCPTSTACIALAYYQPILGGRTYSVPFLETWNGTVWKLVNLPKNESLAQPGDISCVSASACWIVGASDDQHTGGYSPAVAFWNGSLS